MNKIKESISYISKGFLIGVGALIPGLSGGTMAVVTGVFEPLLEATAGIFKHFKKSINLLIHIFIGCVVAIFAVTPLIQILSASFPQLSKYIFCSISAFSTFLFAKNNLFFADKLKTALYITFGATISLLTNVLLTNTSLINIKIELFGLFTIGLLLSLALILPAISFSYMLLFFGLYNKFIESLNSFDLRFLVPLAVGTLLGTLLFSKLLLKAIDLHKQETYAIIFGFSISSVINILIN